MTIISSYWFLLVLATSRTDGLVSEDIMKVILESCYKTENPSNPTVIVGNFSKFNDKISIVRINNSLISKYYGKFKSLSLKPSNVVLMEDSADKITSDLKLLKETKLWDHMVPFFMVGKNSTSCQNSKDILVAMQKMEILNSVYICAKSINNTSALYTLNPITNYAPHPWRRIERLDDLNVYRHDFDANISCTHLTYDKTKILNGFTITAASWDGRSNYFEIGKNYFEILATNPLSNLRALRNVIIASNATGRFEFEMTEDAMLNRVASGSADVTLAVYPLYAFLGGSWLFPNRKSDMIAVVKLGAEVSTLEKIRRLWSTPVLIAAGVALVILFLVLITMNRNFGLALLDITRLLICVGIQTNTNYQSFRIYFTTMLIFMVISNGVFQGKIAAFLTTRERATAIKSIGELVDSGYEMYARSRTTIFAGRKCTKCQFKEVPSSDECIQFVLNGTNNVCAIVRDKYEADFIHLPLDYVEESFNVEFEQFKCRRNWPLHDRINNMMMHLVESGLINFWESQRSSLQRGKRQARDAELGSAQYRPVALSKLVFAFHLLAAGLSLSTIVFFLELLWARSQKKCLDLIRSN